MPVGGGDEADTADHRSRRTGRLVGPGGRQDDGRIDGEPSGPIAGDAAEEEGHGEGHTEPASVLSDQIRHVYGTVDDWDGGS